MITLMSSSMAKLDRRGEGEDETIEFGGLRVPSVMTVSLESFHDVLGCALSEPCDERLLLFDEALLLLSLMEVLPVEYRFLTEPGTPSHFELTLGTVAGSFWLA